MRKSDVISFLPVGQGLARSEKACPRTLQVFVARVLDVSGISVLGLTGHERWEPRKQ